MIFAEAWMIPLCLLIITSLVQAGSHPECKNNYTCFTPEACQLDRKLQPVSEIAQVDDACPVFLRFHPYSNKKTRVVMESFGSLEWIELLQYDADTNAQIKLLTCKKVGGVTTAIQGTATPIKNVISHNTGKLNCEFDVDLSLADANISPKLGNEKDTLTIRKAYVKTATGETKKWDIGATVNCLPSALLTPKDNIEKDKYYAKARYELGHVLCDQAHVFDRMEIRIEDSENYEKVDKIECENMNYQFQLGGSTKLIPSEDEVDVRCVADAEYFCDYDLKYTPNQQALVRQKPDIVSSVKATIECPPSYPFLVIKGQLPIKNAKIKCQNHNGKPRWTVDHTIMTSTGPEVHCIQTLECHIMNPITGSNLKGSFLNEQLTLTCQDGGKLTVSEGPTKGSEVVKVSCDGATGEYKYSTKTGDVTSERSITAKTSFSCEYASEERKETGKSSMLIIGIGTFIGGFVISAVIEFFRIKRKRRRMNALKQQLENVDTQNSEKYKFDTENNDDFFASDYLKKKREEAERNIQCEILPTEIPAEIREKKGLSQEVIDNYGKRPAAVRKFEKYNPQPTEMMGKLMDIQKAAAILHKERLKREKEAKVAEGNNNDSE